MEEYEITLNNKKFLIKREDVINAFNQTTSEDWKDLPGPEPYHVIIIDGKKKPVKAVFRKIFKTNKFITQEAEKVLKNLEIKYQNEIRNELLSKNFMRFTAQPEHWLTTFNTKFFGLSEKKRKFWENIKVGTLFIFHSTNIKYLNTKPKIPTGIIGMGIVGGTREKDRLEWFEEIKTGRNDWPLIVDFSEIWWFGNYKDINDVTIREKIALGENSIIKDLKNLTTNCITFKEMAANNCRIPFMGTVSDIKDKTVKENLVPLLLSRLHESVLGSTHDTSQSELLPIQSEQ
ncbi:MAG: hypothetical protein QXL94_07420, partial [Candidatus Parvarchaeum sp.]